MLARRVQWPDGGDSPAIRGAVIECFAQPAQAGAGGRGTAPARRRLVGHVGTAPDGVSAKLSPMIPGKPVERYSYAPLGDW
jgi:hypothetical protein